MSKEAFVKCEESLCPYDLDETVEWVFIQGLAGLIVRSGQYRVEYVLSQSVDGFSRKDC